MITYDDEGIFCIQEDDIIDADLLCTGVTTHGWHFWDEAGMYKLRPLRLRGSRPPAPRRLQTSL